ncbi:hypothetical protein OG455_12370 [Kitasatospora sp. NBC_01287]|uniref:hypothetical protein n=1 Tax=Kitasatospora sp. NBC_01287 TaxID=2903573 RepID=UPI00225B79CB|nr:hypothetical protein [Kitasatospora sp. NBC_01287]MCX4746313.1 hypothetical protein [Kitasatospora sp. NBC_01287]
MTTVVTTATSTTGATGSTGSTGSPAGTTARTAAGRTAAGLARIAAPALLGVYGLIRLIPGSKQPGAGWTTGHTALLAALLLFGVLAHQLHRLAAERGRIAAGTGFGLFLVGLAASLAQVSIDLWVGLRTSTEAQQNALFAQIQSHPGVLPAVYQIGPLFFYLGLLVLLTVLAVRRRLPFWSPALLLVATLAMAASLDLMTVGAVLYALALAPLGRAR